MIFTNDLLVEQTLFLMANKYFFSGKGKKALYLFFKNHFLIWLGGEGWYLNYLPINNITARFSILNSGGNVIYQGVSFYSLSFRR